MKISQREALRTRALLKKYEDRERRMRNGWLIEWPDGNVICRMKMDDNTRASIRTAAVLGFPVVATRNGDDVVFTAIKVEGMK